MYSKKLTGGASPNNEIKNGDYVMITGITKEKTSHLNGTIVKVTSINEKGYKVIDANGVELKGNLPKKILLRTVYHNGRPCIILGKLKTTELYQIKYLDDNTKKGKIKPSDLQTTTVEIPGASAAAKSKLNTHNLSINLKKSKPVLSLKKSSSNTISKNKTSKRQINPYYAITPPDTPYTPEQKREMERLLDEASKFPIPSNSNNNLSPKVVKNNRNNQISKLQSQLEILTKERNNALKSKKNANHVRKSVLKERNNAMTSRKKSTAELAKQEQKLKHLQNKLVKAEDVASKAQSSLSNLEGKSKKEIFNYLKKAAIAEAKLTKAEERLSTLDKKMSIYNALGDTNGFNQVNITRGLTEMRSKLQMPKKECGVCFDEFTQDQLLLCDTKDCMGNLCLVRTAQLDRRGEYVKNNKGKPIMTSCIDSAIDSAKGNDGSIFTTGELKCEYCKNPYNMDTVIHKLHPETKQKYKQAVNEYLKRTHKSQFNINHAKNIELAEKKAVNNYIKKQALSAKQRKIEEGVQKFIREIQNDPFFNIICERCGASNAGGVEEGGCQAMVCQNVLSRSHPLILERKARQGDMCSNEMCFYCRESFGPIKDAAHAHLSGGQYGYFNKRHGDTAIDVTTGRRKQLTTDCSERHEFKTFCQKNRIPIGGWPMFANYQSLQRYQNFKFAQKIINLMKKLDRDVAKEIIKLLRQNDKKVEFLLDFIVTNTKDNINEYKFTLSVFNNILPPDGKNVVESAAAAAAEPLPNKLLDAPKLPADVGDNLPPIDAINMHILYTIIMPGVEQKRPNIKEEDIIIGLNTYVNQNPNYADTLQNFLDENNNEPARVINNIQLDLEGVRGGDIQLQANDFFNRVINEVINIIDRQIPRDQGFMRQPPRDQGFMGPPRRHVLQPRRNPGPRHFRGLFNHD